MAIQTYAFADSAPDDSRKRVLRSGEELEKWLRFFGAGSRLVVDYETSGTAWYRHARSIGIGLGSWAENGQFFSIYVPYRHRTGETQFDLGRIGNAIKQLLGRLDILKIAHNIKFEDHFTRVEGWQLNGPRYDTMVAARLYDENRPARLEDRVAVDLGLGAAAYTQKKQLARITTDLAKANRLGKTEYLFRHGFSEVMIDDCGYYCCHDVDYCGGLYAFYEHWGLSQFYPRIWATESYLTRILCDMEQNGMLVSVEYLESVRKDALAKMAQAETNIRRLLGKRMFKLGSDAALRRYLIQDLGCSWDEWTKAGRKLLQQKRDGELDPFKHLSVDASVLRQFAPRFEVIQHILDWRESEKIRSTYTDSIIQKLDAQNYVHGDLQQVGTNTGRLSCRQPNYQNMPAGPLIRSAFLTRGPEWVRVFADYSQIELRVLAWYCRDPKMVETYLRGGDIHETTRQAIEDLAHREVKRRLAKVVNFGLSYGLTESGLARQAGIALDDAALFLGSFFKQFPGVQAFRQELWAQARRQGNQWNNLFGRTRRLPELSGGSKFSRARAERQMIGSAIQGTAAELTKESLVRLDQWIEARGLRDRVLLCNTVHDEIQIDVHRSCLTEVVEATTALMENYPEFSPLPIVVDVEVSATNWAGKQPFSEWQK